MCKSPRSAGPVPPPAHPGAHGCQGRLDRARRSLGSSGVVSKASQRCASFPAHLSSPETTVHTSLTEYSRFLVPALV